MKNQLPQIQAIKEGINCVRNVLDNYEKSLEQRRNQPVRAYVTETDITPEQQSKESFDEQELIERKGRNLTINISNGSSLTPSEIGFLLKKWGFIN